jgi:predicted PurR-regulated permease PerM
MRPGVFHPGYAISPERVALHTSGRVAGPGRIRWSGANRDQGHWVLPGPPAVGAFLLVAWTLQSLKSFLGLLFLAWLLSISFEPIVERLHRRGMRRGLATGAVMCGIALVAVGFLAVFGAVLVNQLTDLTLMLFTFYMSAQAPQLRDTVSRCFPPRQQGVISTVWEIAVDKTGSYVVSRFLLAALSSVLTGGFLWVIGVPYWLPPAVAFGAVVVGDELFGPFGAVVAAIVAVAETYGHRYELVPRETVGPDRAVESEEPPARPA